MAGLAANGLATGKLRELAIAKTLNQAAGGTVIAPWDVWELPEEWLDVVPALQQGLPAAQAGIQRIEAAKRRYFEGLRGRR